MVSKTLAVVFAVVLVVTGFWGYREHKQKQALLLKAENQYQRAFHDLASNVNLLQDQLGKSLAINTQRQLTPCLSNVWRISYSAQNDVGQLPLTMMPFNRTQEFLQDLSNFSYRVAIRDQNKEPLTSQERTTLKKLYQQSNDIQHQLGGLQTKVLEKNLRWMDAELALAQTEKKTDNQIVDGFKKMEKEVSGFPEIQSKTITDLKNKDKLQEQNLTGNQASPQEVALHVSKFLGKSDTSGIHVQQSGKGTPYPAYTANVKDQTGRNIHFTITKKGGHVVWMVNDRDVKNEAMDLSQAQEKGSTWLNQHGFKNLTPVNVDQYDNIGVYTFAPMNGKVTMYPDNVTIKVALDNGEVIGYNAQEYLFRHKDQVIPKPTLTMEQARKRVADGLDVKENRLAVIRDDFGKEVLVYEFLGVMDDNTYRILINANNGDEEGIEKMKSA